MFNNHPYLIDYIPYYENRYRKERKSLSLLNLKNSITSSYKDNVKDAIAYFRGPLKQLFSNFDVIIVVPGHSKGHSNFQSNLSLMFEKDPNISSKMILLKRLYEIKKGSRKSFKEEIGSFQQIQIKRGKNILIIDDVTTTGRTLNHYYNYFNNYDLSLKVETFAIGKTKSNKY